MTVDYNNLYVHYVFNTSYKDKLIEEKHRVRIEKYITGIINNNKSKLYAIYANAEHLHMLISKSPQITEEALATIIGDSSAEFINKNNLCRGVFSWQQSCGAFSVSKGDIKRVCNYILNQAEHHKTKSFEDEYADFIRYYQDTIKPKIKPQFPTDQ
ncbi:MAG: transposase [Lentimicrobium sp.]|jgi:REP element-mobilizing transposase RayT|nr:transposase [Lentimicrobium sp.]